jgi:acetyl esterase/lipase
MHGLWCFPTIAWIAACASPQKLSAVSYDDRFGDSTIMDVYLPPGDAAQGRPAILFIHGGSWKAGSRAEFSVVADRFARSGWVTASIEYRLDPSGSYPRMMQDTQCALAFFRAHAVDYGLDPARVAVIGYSAGGHLASVLGVAIDEPDFQPDCAAANGGPVAAPAAVVSGAGPQDLRYYDGNDAVTTLLGGRAADVPARYDAASPSHHVGPGKPPFLFIHGDDDWLVPVAQSRAQKDALVAAGNDARLLVLAGGGHLLNPGVDLGGDYVEESTEQPEAVAAITDFLVDTMGAP